MEKGMLTVRFLLVAGMVAFCLSACGGSNSSPSASATSAAKTASWTNVSVRALDRKVNISWDRASGSAFGAALTSYNLYCSTRPTDIMQSGNRIATNYTGTSFDHTNVTNGQRYYYVVTEVSSAGESPATQVVSATPDAVRPAAPYGLKVTALDSAARLELTGTTPPGTVTVSYNLYRFTSRDLTTNVIMTPFTPAFTDTNLTNGTVYYYAVKAVISGKEGLYSPISAVKPQAIVVATDSSPTQLAAFASPAEMSAEPGNGSCTVKWSDVAPLVIANPDPAASTPYYVLYWSDSPDVLKYVKGEIDDAAKVLTKDSSGLFTYKLTGLINGTTYYFQIAAAVKDNSGNPIAGRFTTGPVVAATPSCKTPATPGGISATQGSQQVMLSWSKDSSGINGITYNIYFSTTDARSPAEMMAKGTRKNNDDSTKAYYTHSGLESGMTYYYVVTAVGEGESAPSNIVSVTL